MKLHWKHLIPYGMVMILLVVAGFYDYEINLKMAHALNGIDMVFERFAILPLILIIVACFRLYYVITNQVLFGILSVIAALYAGFDTMHYWCEGMMFYGTSIIVALLVWVIVACVVAKIPRAHRQNVAYWMMYFTMVLLLSMLVTTLLKNVWGRVRFRDGNGISDFTAWYLPQGINGHKSFPSGHTTAWSAILSFLKMHSHRPLAWWSRLLIYGLILLMPLTRMSCGAHYLSDTVMGFCITYTIYLWMCNIFMKRRLL